MLMAIFILLASAAGAQTVTDVQLMANDAIKEYVRAGAALDGYIAKCRPDLAAADARREQAIGRFSANLAEPEVRALGRAYDTGFELGSHPPACGDTALKIFEARRAIAARELEHWRRALDEAMLGSAEQAR